MRSRTLIATMALLIAAALYLPGAAVAAAPKWGIESLADTATTSPNSAFEYIVDVYNAGDAETSGTAEVTAELPPGMVATKALLRYFGSPDHACTGTTVIHCSTPEPLPPRNAFKLRLVAEVQAGASGILTARFTVSGGGAATATTVDPTLVSGQPTQFGIDSFDTNVVEANGEPSTQGGKHPAADLTDFDFNTETSPVPIRGLAWPVTPARDIAVALPPGLVGNPSAIGRCTKAELVDDPYNRPLCDPSTQVGVATVRAKFLAGGFGPPRNILGTFPIFNLEPPPGVAARFAMNVLGVIVNLDAHVRSGRDYGITIEASNVPEGLAMVGNQVEFWGDPSAPAHDGERGCPGEETPYAGGPTCPGAAEPQVLLRNPTSCTEPGEGLATTLRTDSWDNPGVFAEAVSVSHETPGYPYPPSEWGPEVGIEGCEAEPFEPQISVQPTTQQADSPTGLDVELSMPQHGLEEPEAISESDLKGVRVKLPEGMSINPAAATGQGACTTADIGYLPGTSAPYEFTPDPAACPDSSKVGTVEIETPLLGELDDPKVPHVLDGSVYLAAQGDNPFHSLLALYIAVADEQTGLVLKLPGEVIANEATGQLETVFEDNPQTPFTDLRLHLFGGARAALRTPATCGSYSSQATLTPWSGNAPVSRQSSFEITQGCGGGFAPKLSAGTENPLAGQTSPFSLRITREDGEQALGGLTATLPPGLSGYLKGIAYCPDSALAAVSGDLGTGVGQESSPSCPATSQVGRVTVGAGAGPNPFFTQSGRAYLAGPYKGAPLSLAVVAPAVAGPFDLGSVVVRNALRVDPTTAQITAVSDPLPTILHGIPLDIRDVRVELNRDHFTLNPTSCEPMQIGSAISSTGGATASPSVRFQAAGCDQLGFKPKLGLRLKGQTRRAGYPALTATLTMPPGNANIARAVVTLPHSEFLAQNHLGSSCTRVQYAEGGGGGAGCPANTVYGKAIAYSPLLDQPLAGKVYLRSNGGERELPDLVASLNGQIHIDLVGYVDSNNGGIRTTFATAPDAPVSKFVLKMPGGRKSLLENHVDICRRKHKATVEMDAQNNLVREFRPALQVQGCKKDRRHGKGRRPSNGNRN